MFTFDSFFSERRDDTWECMCNDDNNDHIPNKQMLGETLRPDARLSVWRDGSQGPMYWPWWDLCYVLYSLFLYCVVLSKREEKSVWPLGCSTEWGLEIWNENPFVLLAEPGSTESDIFNVSYLFYHHILLRFTAYRKIFYGREIFVNEHTILYSVWNVSTLTLSKYLWKETNLQLLNVKETFHWEFS